MIKSSIQKVCRWLRSPSKMAIGGVILLTIIGTIVGTNLFNAGMATTNTEQFCSDCHTNDVVPEYQASIHFSNRSGVKAICSDCHVPHEFIPKMVRKMQASTEVYAYFTGKVDTKEKFEKHRLEMAEREWARMKANNSQECRNCHNFNDMDFTQQKLWHNKCTHLHRNKTKPVSIVTKVLRITFHTWKKYNKALFQRIC